MTRADECTPQDLTDAEQDTFDRWNGLSEEERGGPQWFTVAWLGDPSFLPAATGALGCYAGRPGVERLRCSRDVGHDDDHAAHVSPRLMVSRWPQDTREGEIACGLENL